MTMAITLDRAADLLVSAARYNPKVLYPKTPADGLSLRGAVIAAAGSGPAAWPIFDFMEDARLLTPRMAEPSDRDAAVALLREAAALARTPDARYALVKADADTLTRKPRPVQVVGRK